MRKIDWFLIIAIIILAILIVKDIKQVNSDPMSKEISDYYKQQAELRLWVKSVQ